MQVVAEDQAVSENQITSTTQWGISVELLAYIVVAIVAILFRVAELDAVPLSDVEARGALHAWHVVTPTAPGEFVISDSPVTYWTQLISFSTLGGNELVHLSVGDSGDSCGAGTTSFNRQFAIRGKVYRWMSWLEKCELC